MVFPPQGGRPSGSGGLLFADIVLLDRILLWNLGKHWLSPDLHGFYTWVFHTLKVQDGFLSQVASAAVSSWKRWLHEDLSSMPYKFLIPDLSPSCALFGL